MSSIVEHRLAFAAWEWAEHRQPGNLALHVFGNAAALSCLILLFAKIHLPFFGLSLAWVYLGVLLLYHARLDLASASIAALVLALTTGAWRENFISSTITRSSACSRCSACMRRAAFRCCGATRSSTTSTSST